MAKKKPLPSMLRERGRAVQDDLSPSRQIFEAARAAEDERRVLTFPAEPVLALPKVAPASILAGGAEMEPGSILEPPPILELGPTMDAPPNLEPPPILEPISTLAPLTILEPPSIMAAGSKMEAPANLEPASIVEPPPNLEPAANLVPGSAMEPAATMVPSPNLDAPASLAPTPTIEPPPNLIPTSKLEPTAETVPATIMTPPPSLAPAPNLEERGFLQVDHYINDVLQRELRQGSQWQLWYRLYRLSHGFHRDTCLVSDATLRKATGLGANTVRRARAALSARGMIEILGTANTGGSDGGIHYKVYTRLPEHREQPPAKTAVAPKKAAVPKKAAAANLAHMKRNHDHDSKQNHDHAGAPVEIYAALTGQTWTDYDHQQFLKLMADHPVAQEQLEALLRDITSRAPSPPVNFAYYAKSIRNELNKPRPDLRKEYQKIFEEMKGTYAGAAPSLREEAFEGKCLARKLEFDKKLFNEMEGF
jgi:hypothetical protein